MIEELRSVKDLNNFEFTKPLAEIIPQFQQIANCVYPSLYGKSSQIEDAIDRKVDEADMICDFVGGNQYNIFKHIETTKKGIQANITYVSTELVQTLDEIYSSKSPWKLMTKAKETLDAIGTEITTRQDSERQKALANIDSKLVSLTALPAYATLEQSQQSQVAAMFTILKKKAETERYIGNLIAMSSEIANAYERCITSINQWVEDAAERKRKEEEKKGNGGGQQPPQRPVKTYVNKNSAMNVSFSKNVLETKEDVETYIEALKARLLGYIDQNKNIMLN